MSKVINADCLETMKQMSDNSIDTIITDPPYGLSFMGKKWDYDVPGVETWQECLRVLKPGGTALIFAGSRTQHRMACNVEDAGFILKDCIMWLYGSGFPKATDISKQLDKGHKREIILVKNHAKGNFKDNLYAQADANKNNNKIFGYGKEEITVPSTSEAKLWNGWKSHGLKPAYEPILVAIKPNEGTYAQNALKHGVAGLNIDGGRIKTDEIITNHSRCSESAVSKGKYGDSSEQETHQTEGQKQGRFPANIILDEEAAKMLDEQSGESKSTGGRSGHTKAYQGGYKQEYYGNEKPGFGDKGGASRFFYCAKASKAERNAGCEELGEKELGHNRFDKCLKCGGYIFQNQDRESACKCEDPIRQNNKVNGNFHCTVKPLKLMEYLCILTKTPTGGIVLDPYAGSGTTGLACIKTGRDYILIERELEYVEIINARLKEAQNEL